MYYHYHICYQRRLRWRDSLPCPFIDSPEGVVCGCRYDGNNHAGRNRQNTYAWGLLKYVPHKDL